MSMIFLYPQLNIHLLFQKTAEVPPIDVRRGSVDGPTFKAESEESDFWV